MATGAGDSPLLPSDPRYFNAAALAAEAEILEVERLMRAEHGATADAADARYRLSVREAELLVSGQAPGRNDTERKAGLLLAMQQDRLALQLRHTLVAAENGIANNRAALEAARERRSVAKRRMEWAIAWLRREEAT